MQKVLFSAHKIIFFPCSRESFMAVSEEKLPVKRKAVGIVNSRIASRCDSKRKNISQGWLGISSIFLISINGKLLDLENDCTKLCSYLKY